jgi:hypothetical protein
VLITNNCRKTSNHLQASYVHFRHWEKLIDYDKNDCCLKEHHCLTVIHRFNLTEEELHNENMGLYSPGQIMNDALYGQISYISSLSIALKLKVGSNLKQCWVEMTAAAGKNIAKHVT